MGYRSIQRLAALTLLVAAAAGIGFAQGVTLRADPSSLAFNISSGTPGAQDITITSSSGQPVAISVTVGTGVVIQQIVSAPNGQSFTPQTLRVTVNPSLLPAGTTQTTLTVTPAGSIANSLSIPITITGGTGTGTGAFNVSPGSLVFNQTGSTPPAAQSLTVSGSFGSSPPPYSTNIVYQTSSNWLQLFPPPSQTTTNSFVTVSPVSSFLTTGTYQATITLTSTAGTISVPVTLAVNQTSTTSLTVSPSSLSFSFPQGTTTSQSLALNVSSPSGSSVSFTPALSSNLLSFVQVSGTTTGTPAQLLVTIPFPQFVTGPTTGSLTLTPTSGSGLSAVTIPIQINSTGTGFGPLSVSPSSLTFNGNVGSTSTVPTQTLFVTNSSVNAQFFTASASSANNFLFVNASTGVTPGTVTVGVNMSAITTPGTYTGTVTITPTTGTGAGLSTTVGVTLNATSALTVTPNPTSVTLSAAAGAATVQQNVFLASTTADVPFTTSVSTTSGNWLSAGSASTTLPATISISANPANLTTGTYTGSVTVTAQGATVATIPVTLTVTAAATLQLGTSTVTFNHQTTGTSAPAAQVVQITSSGPVINWTATPTSTGGWLQVSPTTGTTPGSLSISVNAAGLAVGTHTGSIAVTSTGATNSPQTVNVTLNVSTPLIPQIVSVINAASGAPTVASPGLIITINGSDLGPATPLTGQVNAQGFVGTTLGDLRVLFDGIAAPVLYASATQVNAVVPYEITGRFSTRMQVEARNQRSREIELRVADTAPGIFTLNSSGTGQGAVLNQNGSVNGPANPERRGNVIVIYATGHGQTTPPGTTGLVMPGTDLRRPIATPIVVRIGGRQAEVLYAGSAPGLIAGALQMNARIPADGPTGSNVPIVIEIGGASSQVSVTIAIQ